jgi:dephospho-CoA kinase
VTAEVVAHFGPEVLAADGSVNRRALGAIVFGNPQALQRLEQIVHPHIGPAIAKRIQASASEPNPPPAMVIEAVKLIQSGRHKIVDQVWFVIARQEIQTERMMTLRGLSAAEAKARLQSQPAIAERLRFAHLIIENNESLEKLEQQVKEGWQRLFS